MGNFSDRRQRGEELGLATYRDEADACVALLQRVLEYDWNRFDLVAGPAPPAEADEAWDLWLNDHGLSRTDLAPDDWRSQDSPWKTGEPDYRRYWFRIKRTRH